MNILRQSALLLTLVCSGQVLAASGESAGDSYWQDNPKSAAELGLMQGYPLRPDQQVDWMNFDRGANSRWSFQNMTAISPHARIDAAERSMPLESGEALLEINAVQFKASDGSMRQVGELLYKSYTDGFLVLKNGKLVDEQYFNGMRADTPHLMMSVTKTYTAMAIGHLVGAGKLETGRLLVEYLPELEKTALANATVQQALDMSAGVKWSEDYSDLKADVFVEGCLFGWGTPVGCPQEPDTFAEYVMTLQEMEMKDGERFHYRSVLTDVLGMLFERVSGQRLTTFFAGHFWNKLGNEHDGYIGVDRDGFPMANGALSASARDVARFGQMLLQDGRFNGQQLVPSDWITDTLQGDEQSRHAFAIGEYGEVLGGWHYRNQTWVKDAERGVMLALGIHGQTIYINKQAGVVIVKQSSQPEAVNLEMYLDTFSAMDAIADALNKTMLSAND